MKKKTAKAAGKGLRGRDFVSIDDCSAGEIRGLLALGSRMKAAPRKYRKVLEGKMMALIFEKPSLRTRTTFTVGIKQLGGDSLLLTPADINLGKRESVYDVAKNLERMVDGIMIRTFGHDICTSLAEHAAIPVINGLTDLEHPCQAHGGLLHDHRMQEEPQEAQARVRRRREQRGAFADADGARSRARRCTWGRPEGTGPIQASRARSRELAAASGGSIVWTADPSEAVRGADVVYTDTWASMGQEAEAEARRAGLRARTR